MNKNNKISFEDALRDLEEIVENLNNDDLNLEEAISAYEKGMELMPLNDERFHTEFIKEYIASIFDDTQLKEGQEYEFYSTIENSKETSEKQVVKKSVKSKNLTETKKLKSEFNEYLHRQFELKF